MTSTISIVIFYFKSPQQRAFIFVLQCFNSLGFHTLVNL